MASSKPSAGGLRRPSAALAEVGRCRSCGPLGPRYHAPRRSRTAACCITTSRGGCRTSWRSNTSSRRAGTSYATFRAALVVLDAIAELKRTDAIVCDAANMRLSDRLMERLGWEPHKPQRWHRNFHPAVLRERIRADAAAVPWQTASAASDGSS